MKKLLYFWDGSEEFREEVEKLKETSKKFGGEFVVQKGFPRLQEFVDIANREKPHVIQFSSTAELAKLPFQASGSNEEEEGQKDEQDEKSSLDSVELLGRFKQIAKSPECIILNFPASDEFGRKLANTYNFVVVRKGSLQPSASCLFFVDFYRRLIETSIYPESFKKSISQFKQQKKPLASDDPDKLSPERRAPKPAPQERAEEGQYCLHEKKLSRSQQLRLRVLANSNERMKYVLGQTTTPNLPEQQEKKRIQALVEKIDSSGATSLDSTPSSEMNARQKQKNFSMRQFATLILIFLSSYLDNGELSSLYVRFLNLIVLWVMFESAIFAFLFIQKKLVDVWDYVWEAKLILSDFLTLILGFTGREIFNFFLGV